MSEEAPRACDEDGAHGRCSISTVRALLTRKEEGRKNGDIACPFGGEAAKMLAFHSSL
jgi:hypothetical protein